MLSSTARRALTTGLTVLFAVGSPALAPATDAPCHGVDVNETPADDTDDVEVCTLETFARRTTAPVGNLGATGAQGYPTLSAEAPTAAEPAASLGSSVTDIALGGDPEHGFTVEGTFTGAIDSLAVDVFVAMPGTETNDNLGIRAFLEIDGVEFASPGDRTDVPVTTDGSYRKASFALKDLLAEAEWFGLDLSDPDAEHTLRLNLTPFYFGEDGAFLFDAADAPTSVTFNLPPEQLSGYTAASLY